MLRISSSLIAVACLLTACSSNDDYDYGADGDVGETEQVATSTSQIDSAGLSADQPQPGSQEELELSVGDRVFFDFDSAVLSPVATETLDRQGAWLRQYPNLVVTVEGHADERGTREYNLAIGDRRATAVRNYLLALNVPPNQILTISYGEERPAEAGNDESAWAANRRAVTVVTATN
jgi:peptidoglycan-associated lipoprotein